MLLGSQEPTYLWHPPYADTLGAEAAALYETSGGVLDPWQRLALEIAMAVNPDRTWTCFEVAIIVSRQNGKGEVLIALELAWLFLFGEKLIIHSAHLFETIREHFLKIQAIIENTPAFSRRVATIKEGRGSEEIILKSGARLKFMSRKGGAARGFTGGKLVLDEAMYLDAGMMAAGLPTMATRRDAQVIYAASAGMKISTQLALVRRRGLRQDDGIGLLMWEAERAVYDERGQLTGGDDPADPRTHAKVNPAYGIRIDADAVRREAIALGGYESLEFGIERLGIGDYPEDDDRWEVISKDDYKRCTDLLSVFAPVAPRSRMLALAMQNGITTLAVAGRRLDGKIHFEVIARHRGSQWVIDKLMGSADVEHPILGQLGLWERLGRPMITTLHTDEAAETLIKFAEAIKDEVRPKELQKVVWPTQTEYTAACSALIEGMRRDKIVHIGQTSIENALAAAVKRVNLQGGWQWSREPSVEQAPIIAATLAVWLLETYGRRIPKSQIW